MAKATGGAHTDGVRDILKYLKTLKSNSAACTGTCNKGPQSFHRGERAALNVAIKAVQALLKE